MRTDTVDSASSLQRQCFDKERLFACFKNGKKNANYAQRRYCAQICDYSNTIVNQLTNFQF